MKLGILVVYLFTAVSEPLLDLHLGRIRRYTQEPYTIYAGINRLAPEFREHLAQYPQVRMCDIPDTDLRGAPEHSFYLDHLAAAAIADGATHLVTLHLDSFPIRPSWAEDLANRLSERCVLATIDSVNTACLFFHRDFYCRYHPAFMVTKEEGASALYRKFLMEYDLVQHSGTGYAYRAYQHALTWNYLHITPILGTDGIGSVFDGMIFHLRHAIWIGEQYPRHTYPLKSIYSRSLAQMTRVYRSVLPVGVRKTIRRYFAPRLHHTIDDPLLVQHAQRIRAFLRADPEAYISSIESRVRLMWLSDRSGDQAGISSSHVANEK